MCLCACAGAFAGCNCGGLVGIDKGDAGASPSGSVASSAPYEWYAADAS